MALSYNLLPFRWYIAFLQSLKILTSSTCKPKQVHPAPYLTPELVFSLLYGMNCLRLHWSKRKNINILLIKGSSTGY
jgi:hypothetical protein